MSATINITTGTGTATVTLSTGARGPVGANGESGSASISDTAYNATSWNGVTDIAPSKNAVRDKFETLGNASTKTTSGGGEGVGDSGKVAVYGSTGSLQISDTLSITAGDTNNIASIVCLGLTASNRQLLIPDADGTIAVAEETQPTLVSGTNIKTINGSSVLGSGNLTITSDLTSGPVTSSGGVSAISDSALTIEQTAGLQAALDGKARSIETKTSNFTAVVGGRYITESGGTISITDPSGTTAGQSYEVWIGSGNVQFNGTGTSYAPSRFSIRRRYTGSAWATPSPLLTDTLTVGGNTWSGSTFTGAQTFAGQQQLTGQAATDANSAMTRGLSDTRYLQKFVVRQGSQLSKTNSTYESLISQAITAGTYRIRAFCWARVANNGSTAGGAGMQVSGVTLSSVSGMNTKQASHTSSKTTSYLVSTATPSVTAAPSDFTNTEWTQSGFGGVRLEMDITAVCTAGTLSVDVAQTGTNAEPTLFLANQGTLIIEKIQ